MIVIVIIVLLTQMGNIGWLFRSRERNKVEEVAVKIVAAIDEEKVNALLGKTLDGKIVRKRLASIDFWEKNTLTFTSEVNLAETNDNTYDADSKITKSWTQAPKNNRCDFEEMIAKISGSYADAMLKQREL